MRLSFRSRRSASPWAVDGDPLMVGHLLEDCIQGVDTADRVLAFLHRGPEPEELANEETVPRWGGNSVMIFHHGPEVELVHYYDAAPTARLPLADVVWAVELWRDWLRGRVKPGTYDSP